MTSVETSIEHDLRMMMMMMVDMEEEHDEVEHASLGHSSHSVSTVLGIADSNGSLDWKNSDVTVVVVDSVDQQMTLIVVASYDEGCYCCC